MTYEQSYKDHSYLWGIDAAYDMTGGYVDQEDLDKLLKSPNKRTAKACLENQIDYWFDVGPDTGACLRASMEKLAYLIETDERVREIGESRFLI